MRRARGPAPPTQASTISAVAASAAVGTTSNGGAPRPAWVKVADGVPEVASPEELHHEMRRRAVGQGLRRSLRGKENAGGDVVGDDGVRDRGAVGIRRAKRRASSSSERVRVGMGWVYEFSEADHGVREGKT